jgi:hypothetical protein
MPVQVRPRAPSLKKRSQVAAMQSGFSDGDHFIYKIALDHNRKVTCYRVNHPILIYYRFSGVNKSLSLSFPLMNVGVKAKQTNGKIKAFRGGRLLKMSIQEKVRSFCEQDNELGTDDPKFEQLVDDLTAEMVSSLEETISFLQGCDKKEFEEISGLLSGVFAKTRSIGFLRAVAEALSRYPDISGAPMLKELLRENGITGPQPKAVGTETNDLEAEKREWEEGEYAQDSFELFLLFKKIDKLFGDFCCGDFYDWEIYAQVYQAKDLNELDIQVKNRLHYEAKTFHHKLTQDYHFTYSKIDKIKVIPVPGNFESVGGLARFCMGDDYYRPGAAANVQRFDQKFGELVGPYSLVRLQSYFNELKVDFPFEELYILDYLFVAFASDKAILIGWGSNE